MSDSKSASANSVFCRKYALTMVGFGGDLSWLVFPFEGFIPHPLQGTVGFRIRYICMAWLAHTANVLCVWLLKCSPFSVMGSTSVHFRLRLDWLSQPTMAHIVAGFEVEGFTHRGLY